MSQRDGGVRDFAFNLNIVSGLAAVEPSSFASFDEVGDLGIDFSQWDPFVAEALDNFFDRVKYLVKVGMLFHTCR